MHIRLKSGDFKELTRVLPLAEENEAEYHLEYTGVKGVMRETVLDGVVIEQRTVNIEKNLLIEVKHDTPLFKLQFELDGHSIYSKNRHGSLDVEIGKGQQNFFYFPEVSGLLTYPGPLTRSTLEIYFSVEYIINLFSGDLRALGDLAKAIAEQQPALLSGKSLPITTEIRKVIHNIIHCPFSGAMRKVYLGAKVAELIILQSQTLPLNQEHTNSKMHADDKEKFYWIKECIESHITKPFSIESLSRLVGMSPTKLKTGFKKLFQVTLSEHLINARMTYASNELLLTDKSIAIIAEEVGYKNPQHFATAFKRKFGYSPSMGRQIDNLDSCA